MKRELTINPAVLPELLEYNCYTGELIWLPRPHSLFNTKRAHSTWNAQWPGREALACVGVAGYEEGTLLTVRVYKHRVCWAHHHGMWPEDEVDHINGNTVDNRLVNLRACSRKNNIRNSHKRGAFTSRFLGVCWNKRQKKWVAQITVDHKNSNLGFYHEEELAALAYDAAAREHFGAFANCNFKEPS